MGVDSKNSSDLSSGRRPLFKSDEFSGTTPLVVEIMRETAKIKCYPLSEHHSMHHVAHTMYYVLLTMYHVLLTTYHAHTCATQ